MTFHLLDEHLREFRDGEWHPVPIDAATWNLWRERSHVALQDVIDLLVGDDEFDPRAPEMDQSLRQYRAAAWLSDRARDAATSVMTGFRQDRSGGVAPDMTALRPTTFCVAHSLGGVPGSLEPDGYRMTDEQWHADFDRPLDKWLRVQVDVRWLESLIGHMEARPPDQVGQEQVQEAQDQLSPSMTQEVPSDTQETEKLADRQPEPPKTQALILEISDTLWPDGRLPIRIDDRNNQIREAWPSGETKPSDKTFQRAFAFRRPDRTGQ